ncbi:MAG: MBL fold metallo-hydrolase [Deltaproteobacteria bacterium]|nr:MBL fold metallo-hydrolase [Deltaproteobacteria bacterium]
MSGRIPRTALAACAAAAVASSCAYSSHAVRPSDLGQPISSKVMEAALDLPGPVTLETIVSADWVVPLAGLLNLGHPKAKAAGLRDRDEPMQIYLHALRHPTRGLWVVDTGVAKVFKDHPSDLGIGWLVARELHLEKMTTRTALGPWLAAQKEPLAGVMLTHLHIDHISGMPDVPRGTPTYAGPGETTPRAATHLVLAGSIDALLAGHGPLRQWSFGPDPDGAFDGIVDVFGDGSVFAIFVPGHTPGSTAYAVRTPKGPVLLVGDNCHTRWGWDNGVEPGHYTGDQPLNAQSLGRLRALAARHPAMVVRLGHQD